MEVLERSQPSPKDPSNAAVKPMTHWVYSLLTTVTLGWLFFALPILLLSQYQERRKFGRVLGLVIAGFFLVIGISARIKEDIQVVGWWLLLPLTFVGVVVLSKWKNP